MPNLILEVDEIQDYIRREMPEGGEWLVKKVPVLLRRIAELERALAPFARQAQRERSLKTKVPLTQVYIKDCDKAVELLSKDYARRNMPPQEEMSAE